MRRLPGAAVMAGWRKGIPVSRGKILLQWANAFKRTADPFFWLSLIPLAGALALLGYGLTKFDLPDSVTVALFLLAGAALLRFGSQWSVHYENITVTSEAIVRAFPQKEATGLMRLFPPLWLLSFRPRHVPWTEVVGVRRFLDRMEFEQKDGGKASLRLKPLRLVIEGRVVDVRNDAQTRTDGAVVSREEAWQIITDHLHRAFLESCGRSAAHPRSGE